jgi:hypothetical protein
LVSAVLGVALAAGWLGGIPNPIPPDKMAIGGLQFGLFAAGGLSIVALAVVEVWRHRDAETWLLGLWVVGTFTFASFVNWSINGRSILPMVPAVGILLARRLDDPLFDSPRRSATRLYGPVFVAMVVALAVAGADARLAGAARVTVATIEKKMRGESGALWFQGHWGFQHYMEAIGGRPLNAHADLLRAGDRVAIPYNNTNTWPLSDDRILSSEAVETEGPLLLSTMHPQLGAGFYSDILGPLPFSFGDPPPEGCTLVLIRVPRGGQDQPGWH